MTDTTADHIDPKVLARVRALLAKAESTTFPEEADALTAKAQELMARHAIDQARLAGSAHGRAGSVAIVVEDPYASAKSLLLGAVARASRCEVVWHTRSRTATVFGFPADLEATELLYTSLLLQATTAVQAEGRAGPASRTRGFRNAFLVAYARRVGERLQRAADASVAAATREHGAALLPVLAERSDEVRRALEEAFPRVGTRRVQVSDRAGWRAGTAAADTAALGRPGVRGRASRPLGPSTR